MPLCELSRPRSIVLIDHYKMGVCKNYPRGIITKKLNVQTEKGAGEKNGDT
jgi:hypothetical protein